MEVSGQHHAPAAVVQERILSTCWRAPEPVWFGEDKNLLPLPRFETWTFQPVAQPVMFLGVR